jgi:hypothetical protein
LFLGATDDGGSEWVLAVLFQGSRKTQDLFAIESLIRQDSHQLGSALGERARLVHDQDRDLLQPFQGLGVFQQHPFPGATADPDHDGHGRSKTEGAGASDDENGNGIDDGMGEPWLGPKPQPQGECQQGDGNHRRHEQARHLVGEALDGGSTALGVGHHGDDLTQHGIAANPLGAHHKTAGAVDGTAGHPVADRLFHRQRLPGHHGLFHT